MRERVPEEGAQSAAIGRNQPQSVALGRNQPHSAALGRNQPQSATLLAVRGVDIPFERSDGRVDGEVREQGRTPSRMQP